MLLAVSIFGIFLSIILLYFNARNTTPWVYLILLFLIVSITGLNYHVLLFSKSVILVSIIFVNIGPLHFLGGPTLYWYIRSILTADTQLTRKDIWHLLPMIINFALILPYVNTPYLYKVLLAQEVIRDMNFILTFQPTRVPNELIFIGRPLFFLGYTLYSFVLFLRHRLLKQDIRIFSDQRFIIKWIYLLLSFVLLLMIGNALIMAKAFEQETFSTFLSMNGFWIFLIGLAGIIISPFFFPGVLYGVTGTTTLALPPVQSNIPEEPEDIENKKSTLYLDDAYLHTIGQKADVCMQECQAFRTPDLNLIKFSVMIKIPTHHLAYYFREVRMQSFIDYRNTWRVKYAKELISAGQASGQTLEAIGIQSGFTARSSFITAFKKAEGISPSTFAAQCEK